MSKATKRLSIKMFLGSLSFLAWMLTLGQSFAAMGISKDDGPKQSDPQCLDKDKKPVPDKPCKMKNGRRGLCKHKNSGDLTEQPAGSGQYHRAESWWGCVELPQVTTPPKS